MASWSLPVFSERTRLNIQSAHWAWVVHIFEPLSRKWSPLSSHFIISEARSEPEPGSE